jgi:hypothetical protein
MELKAMSEVQIRREMIVFLPGATPGQMYENEPK